MSVASASAAGHRCGVGSGINGAGSKFRMMQRRDIVTKGITLSICSSLLSSSNGSAQGLERLPFKADGYSFWTWRGRRIHYVEQGSGQPIVLIHGFGASAFHWRYNIPELAKMYKVYAIDLLGFGWSEKAVVEYDATIWMEQVSDFLREVVKSPSILVGNSLGGFTTLFTATELPELVRGVVLLNSAGQFGDPNAPPKAAEEEEEEEVSAVTRLVVRPLKEAFQRVVLGFLFWQAKQPARVEKVLKSVYKDPSNVDDYLIGSITAPTADPNAGEVYYRPMSRFMANQSRYALDSLLSKLSCPLLLLWGDLDPWVGSGRRRPRGSRSSTQTPPSSTCRPATARTTRRRSRSTRLCSSGSRPWRPEPNRPSKVSRPCDSCTREQTRALDNTGKEQESQRRCT